MDSKETKKAHLVETASKLFYTQGYKATGVKQIIEDAGIAKGTFYSHFKSKEDLGIAWLQKRHSIWNGAIEQHVEQNDSTPKEKILALFTFLKKWMGECKYRGCAFINTMTESPDISCSMRKEVRHHKKILLEYIESLVAKATPESTPEEITKNSQVIYLLFEAALLETQNFAETWPIDAAHDQVEALLSN